MSKKKRTKIRTGILLDCPCGAKGMIYEIGECRWFAHCPACGRLVFISSAQVFERAKAGGKLCSHTVELKPCKDGVSQTGWCPKCRTRVFEPMPPAGKGGQ